MSKRTLYAFIVSFILLIIVIILNRVTFEKESYYTRRVNHTRDVITAFENISNDFKSAEVYSPLAKNSEEKQLYNIYKKDAEQLPAALIHLKKLVSDNPQQLRLADSLSALIMGQYPVLLTKVNDTSLQQAQAIRFDAFGTIHNLIEKGIDNEKYLLDERESYLANSTYLTNFLTTFFAIIAVAIILITFFYNFIVSNKRRWLEGFLESVLNTSQNGIVYYKVIREHGKIIDFRIDYANKAIKDLLLVDPSEVIGKRLKDISSFVRQSDLFEKYFKVAESGQPMEFEILYKSALTEKWMFVSLSRMEGGITASFHNISQLKKYEHELKEKINELERSNTELEQYAYVASHDLQEPLRKIRSFGSFLQETQGNKMDEKGRQQLDKIMLSAERMAVLIKDILSFSSLRRDDLFVKTDLNKIVKGVLQDLDLMIVQKKAIVHTDPLPVIESIPLQMTQLIYNLLNNSLKFARENIIPDIRITCRLATNDERKKYSLILPYRYYLIEFRDNGIGFSEDYREHIFGLFKRLNDKQFYPGSGIGLALCKKVVENHQGVIMAKGNVDHGSTFTVLLPEKQGGSSEK